MLEDRARIRVALSVPKIKFDSAAQVIRLSGVSETQKKVIDAIVSRLRTLGYTVHQSGAEKIRWYFAGSVGGSIRVYSDNTVVGNLPGEYYL